MSKKVLVTGGAGFVGSHMVDELLRCGYEVRVYDNLVSQVHNGTPPEYLATEAEFIWGDVRDLEALTKALRDVEVVFHLAAAVGVGQSMYEISRYMNTNTQGTANLLQALLNSKCEIERLVVASSMSIYGEGKYLCAQCGVVSPLPRSSDQLRKKQWEARCPNCSEAAAPMATGESKPAQCSSVYALTKRNQEEMALLFGRTYQVPVVAMRYFNIYGRRQALSNPYTGVAAIFSARLLNGRAPVIFEDGMQMRDFVNIADVVRANMLALENTECKGMALNVGSGHPISIREIAAALAQALGLDIQAEIAGKYRAGDIRHCYADISLARSVLGYQPQYTFAEGVYDLVTWVREQGAADGVARAADELKAYGLTA